MANSQSCAFSTWLKLNVDCFPYEQMWYLHEQYILLYITLLALFESAGRKLARSDGIKNG